MKLAGYHKRVIWISNAHVEKFKDHAELRGDVLVKSVVYPTVMNGTVSIRLPVTVDSTDIVNKTVYIYYWGKLAWK